MPNKNGALLKSLISRKAYGFKMKKYFALILVALVTKLAFAQRNYHDIVYLKNGSIIRGAIIEQVPDKSIKTETIN